MRFLALFLFVIIAFSGALAQIPDSNADYYIMADYELSLDPYDFDIQGGLQSGFQLPVQATHSKGALTLPIQSETQQPITLPIQQATQQLITLPVQHASNAPINLQPVVTNKVIQQPVTQYRYIEQPIIQPRLIEQPKLQQRIVTQPIYRQLVTQPVIVPRVTTQPIINQRVVEQPIVQHRVIEQTTVQPQLIEVPVTNKAIHGQAIQLEAQPIMHRSNVQAQPILRQAAPIQQAPITQSIQATGKAHGQALQQPVLGAFGGLGGLGGEWQGAAPMPAGLRGFRGLEGMQQMGMQQPVMGGGEMEAGQLGAMGGMEGMQQQWGAQQLGAQAGANAFGAGQQAGGF